MLISQGLTESLAGRFELLHLPHWSYTEMRSAFDWSLEQFVFYGGYPGAASLIRDEQRWPRYILDSLIETTIARDGLLQTRVDKPAMLRGLSELGCRYSSQILSYTKMLGQLQDAGNSTMLAHYLDLLAGVGMVCVLQKVRRWICSAARIQPQASDLQHGADDGAIEQCNDSWVVSCGPCCNSYPLDLDDASLIRNRTLGTSMLH